VPAVAVRVALGLEPGLGPGPGIVGRWGVDTVLGAAAAVAPGPEAVGQWGIDIVLAAKGEPGPEPAATAHPISYMLFALHDNPDHSPGFWLRIADCSRQELALAWWVATEPIYHHSSSPSSTQASQAPVSQQDYPAGTAVVAAPCDLSQRYRAR
jgi:hypothetical protein